MLCIYITTTTRLQFSFRWLNMNAYLIIQAITFRIHVVVVDGSGAIRNFKLQFEYAFIVLFLLFTVCRYFPFSFRSLFFNLFELYSIHIFEYTHGRCILCKHFTD